MRNLLNTEFYKIIHSNQMMVILLFLVLYIGVLPFFLASPGQYTTFELYRNVTSDIAVMTIFISLTSSVVFANEYTNKTMKSSIQCYTRTQVFFIKLLIVGLSTVALLAIWYLLGASVVMIKTHSIPDSIIFMNYIKRFSIQILFIMMQSLVLLSLSIIIQKQAIVNICSFVVFFVISFTAYYQWFNMSYPWGNWGLPASYISLLVICILLIMINYNLFKRQEIK